MKSLEKLIIVQCTTRMCSTIIIASSSSSTDHIEYPQKDQHDDDNDNQHSDKDAHNTHRQFAGALLQGEDTPGRYSLELSLITRPSHPSIHHAVLTQGKVKFVVRFCFLFFVTPDGFTTVVANEGLEKARAYLNQIPQD